MAQTTAAANGIKGLNGATRPAVFRSASSSSTLRPHSRTRKRRHRSGANQGWKPMFHLSLALAVAAIVAVWIVTPLSWAYVLWTALTQIPALSRGRPAPPSSSTVFKVLHYITLAYTSSECLFSIYYRFLAFKCQKLRPPLRHSRKHLRQLFLTALENGTTLEDEEEAYKHRNHLVPHCHDGPEAVVEKGRTDEDVARDEEEAARGSDDGEIKLPPLARRRTPRHVHADGGQTPELATTDLPVTDYMSARQLAPTAAGGPIRNGAELEDRTDAASVSRMSMRSLDSAMPSSPQSASVRSLRLPTKTILAAKEAAFEVDANKDGTARHASDHHPHSRFLPRLTPEDPRAHDFREYVRHWFGGVEFSEIKRDNMADWLAWSMYGQPLHEIEHERKEWDRAGRPALYCADGVTLDTDTDLDHHLDEEDDQADLDDAAIERRRREQTFDSDKLGFIHFCLTLCEARAASRFAPGRNPSVTALRLTLDPVRVVSRPLLLYGVVALLQNAIIGRAKLRGFREYDDGDATRYLLRMPEGWEPRPDLGEDERPLIFLHGLGMGMAQYATLVSVLGKSRALRRRPILVLLQPHISMSFFQRGYLDPPDQKRCTTGLARALRLHRMDERAGGCTVLSHSNGTIVHGWLLKDCPELVTRSCLVDPVSFMLYEPWVCARALYNKPSAPIEFLMRYFVMRELGIAHMLSRTFEWTSNLLFPCEIPNRTSAHATAVFLASNDSIIHADRVRVYLRRNGLREVHEPHKVGQDAGAGGLKVFQGLRHGESMIGEGPAFEEILRWVTWDGRDASAYETGASSSSSAGSGDEVVLGDAKEPLSPIDSPVKAF
ncbi:hypothetical protein JCM3774_002914 [Rhodotorula dairenensis]